MPPSAGFEVYKENKPKENTTRKYRNAQDAQKCGQTKPSGARHEVIQANKAKQTTTRKLPLKRPLQNHNSASCGETPQNKKNKRNNQNTTSWVLHASNNAQAQSPPKTQRSYLSVPLRHQSHTTHLIGAS